MSYAYQSRKKAIKHLKKDHDTNKLEPKQMPVNPHPPKCLGTLAELVDANCVSLPDGSCVATEPCMHDV